MSMESNAPNESHEYEAVNKHLLENQSYLYTENMKLQEDVNKLSKQLDDLRRSSINPQIFEALKKEKDNLLSLNQTLKQKIKHLKSPPKKTNKDDLELEYMEKEDILRTIKDLDKLLEKIKEAETLEIPEPEDGVTKTIENLTKKIAEQERKLEEANDLIRKLRDDDEKYILKERINDMKQLVTDLEVENTKLKFESEQLAEDAENYKKQMLEAMEEAKLKTKQCYELEDEKDKLRDIISNLENEKIKLKKDMIEEMNEANRAKRVSVDTEIALQHISEAYENKRQEVMALEKQLEDAENIIKGFQEQLPNIKF